MTAEREQIAADLQRLRAEADRQVRAEARRLDEADATQRALQGSEQYAINAISALNGSSVVEKYATAKDLADVASGANAVGAAAASNARVADGRLTTLENDANARFDDQVLLEADVRRLRRRVTWADVALVALGANELIEYFIR